MTLARILREHLTTALLVGLVVGTCIGVGEGVWVLMSQGVLGRYNELVAWAILFDAGALIALELGLAVVNGLFFFRRRLAPLGRQRVALQLAETIFVLALGLGIWSQGMADSSRFAADPLGALAAPALASILLGEAALVICLWIMQHAPLVRRLRASHWLVFEGVVVALAIAFGFTR